MQKESELPLEELLKTLPKEMLDEPSSHLPFDDDDESDETSSKDSELAQVRLCVVVDPPINCMCTYVNGWAIQIFKIANLFF